VTDSAGGARRKRRRASRATGPPQVRGADMASPGVAGSAVHGTGVPPAAGATDGESGTTDGVAADGGAAGATGGAAGTGAGGGARPRRAPRKRADAGGDRGLRDLVGAGPSQVGPVGAARARDMNRPTAEELLEAEREVQVVRRNWRPPS
jgi:hypothetical protein